jgi:carbon-monoxide dehydrogenase large subunit
VVSVDASPAKASAGVVAVFTADDLDLGPYPMDVPGLLLDTMHRPWLADGVVRYVGEPVAAVVTETRAQGADAAALVDVAYELLPAVVDPEQALAGEVLLHPQVGSNICGEVPGGEELDWSGCEVVVRARLLNQKLAPCPLEVRAAASAWGEDGRLTHWASTQGPHPLRAALAGIYGLEAAQVRVITPDVGGGFGSKLHYPEELLCPWLARRLSAPVRWTETRSESMVGLGHGRAQI